MLSALNLLTVPDVERKKSNTVRQRLPVIVGKRSSSAVRILQKKRRKKKSHEKAKYQWKIEKKLQKLEEKEKIGTLREQAKKRREEEQLLKAASKDSKRKIRYQNATKRHG